MYCTTPHQNVKGRLLLLEKNLNRIWQFNILINIGSHPNVFFSVIWLHVFSKHCCIFDIQDMEMFWIQFSFYTSPPKIKKQFIQKICLEPKKYEWFIKGITRGLFFGSQTFSWLGNLKFSVENFRSLHIEDSIKLSAPRLDRILGKLLAD